MRLAMPRVYARSLVVFARPSLMFPGERDPLALEVLDAAVCHVDDAVATGPFEERRRERASVTGAACDGKRRAILRELLRHALPQLAIGDMQRPVDVARAPLVPLADVDERDVALAEPLREPARIDRRRRGDREARRLPGRDPAGEEAAQVPERDRLQLAREAFGVGVARGDDHNLLV